MRRRRGDARRRRRLHGARTAALIGYTNAGKSSLMEALCGVVRTSRVRHAASSAVMRTCSARPRWSSYGTHAICLHNARNWLNQLACKCRKQAPLTSFLRRWTLACALLCCPLAARRCS